MFENLFPQGKPLLKFKALGPVVKKIIANVQICCIPQAPPPYTVTHTNTDQTHYALYLRYWGCKKTRPRGYKLEDSLKLKIKLNDRCALF